MNKKKKIVISILMTIMLIIIAYSGYKVIAKATPEISKFRW